MAALGCSTAAGEVASVNKQARWGIMGNANGRNDSTGAERKLVGGAWRGGFTPGDDGPLNF